MTSRQGRLRLGTRGSALARTQATMVAEALTRAHPEVRVELVEITTQGDRTQHTNQPAEQWGQGVFVREIEKALLEEWIDFAVHSFKDLPPVDAEGLRVGAIPERADPRDVLVTTNGATFGDLPGGSKIGTSSSRRAAFLRAMRPDLVYTSIRGNVDTRVRKLQDGEYDGIVLASAGLARLGLDVPQVAFDLGDLPWAPGQGALAIQIREADAEVGRLLAALHHGPTAAAVTAERRAMAVLEGGCRLPVAASGWVEAAEQLYLLVAVAAVDGSRVLRAEGQGWAARPAELAESLAGQLQAAGAADLLQLVGGAAA